MIKKRHIAVLLAALAATRIAAAEPAVSLEAAFAQARQTVTVDAAAYLLAQRYQRLWQLEDQKRQVSAEIARIDQDLGVTLARLRKLADDECGPSTCRKQPDPRQLTDADIVRRVMEVRAPRYKAIFFWNFVILEIDMAKQGRERELQRKKLSAIKEDLGRVAAAIHDLEVAAKK